MNTPKRMIIDFTDVDDITVSSYVPPTKEEIFKVIERLLVIETID